MLSKTKYAALCVLGMEIFYVLCIGYGLMLSGKAMELHHGLFELIPGFVWGNVFSMVGCLVPRCIGVDRRLVHRLDAQCES